MDTESQELLLRPLAAFFKTEVGTPPLLPSLPPFVSVSETDSVTEETVSRRRRRRTSPPPTPQRFKHPEDIGPVREHLFSFPDTIVWTREQHIAYWPYVSKHVLALAKQWDLRSEETHRKWRAYLHPISVEFPEISGFPSPIQTLLAVEIEEAKLLLMEEEVPRVLPSTPEIDSQEGRKSPSCECRFYRKWQLPCRHIWQHHVLFGVLTQDALAEFLFLWEDGGYEIYEGITTEWVTRGLKEAIGAPVRRRLDIQEVLDSLMTKYYDLETDVKTFAPEDADRVMTWWIERLQGATGSLGKADLVQFMEEMGWEDKGKKKK